MAEDADQSAHYQQAEAPVNAQEQVLTLATALVLEAGGEKAPGAMQAVLNVISNRAKGDFYRAYTVVLKPYQFSALNSYTVEHGSLSALINRASQHPRWNEAISLVQKLQQHKLVDITGGQPTIMPPGWTAKGLLQDGLKR